MSNELLQFTVNNKPAAVKAVDVRYIGPYTSEDGEEKTAIECYSVDLGGSRYFIYSTDKPADVINSWQLALFKATPTPTPEPMDDDVSNSLFIVREALEYFSPCISVNEVTSERLLLLRLLEIAGFIMYDHKTKLWHVTESGKRVSGLALAGNQ